MAEYYWMPLSMSENVWIDCSDYARVFNILQYSYIIIIIIIIIVTNGITSRRTPPLPDFNKSSLP